MIQIAPTNPSVRDDVAITATFSGCVDDSGMTQSGFAFTGHIHYQPICFATPPGGQWSFPVGKLAVGSYTVTVQEGSDIQTGSFVVANIGSTVVPAIQPLGLVLLAALILVAASRLLRH